MARFFMVCFVLLEILMVQAMCESDKSVGSSDQVNQVEVADQPSSSTSEMSSSDGGNESNVAEGPSNRRLGKHEHHSTDKSVAGGGVIIGGLVTAIFAAVFCYIRVTRKSKSDDLH